MTDKQTFFLNLLLNKKLFILSVQKIQLGPASGRTRVNADTNFADTEVEELIAMLRETENLEEQGDILQYLVDNQGLDYNTGKLSCIQFIDTLLFLPVHPRLWNEY